MLLELTEHGGGPAEPSLVGHKAASLLELIRWGLPVPPAAVVTTRAFDALLTDATVAVRVAAARGLASEPGPGLDAALAAVREAIAAAPLPPPLRAPLDAFLSRNPGPLAVRSSGVSEDLGGASFAGLYTTVLNVRTRPEVEAALRTCWASAFTPRVLGYSRDRGVPLDRLVLAVVLQELVPADESGVAFTVDPVTGADREVVVEACFGLGEALVGGTVTPDRYRYDWFADVEVAREVAEKEIAIVPADGPEPTATVPVSAERRRAAVLGPDDVRALGRLAVEIQARYGFPVDVEWARRDGRLAVLQARPITRIRHDGIEGEWTTADFKDGGVSSTVCTPFMWSLYDRVWRSALPAYVQRVGLLDRDPGIVWGRMFYGRPYWNVGEIKRCLKRLPGFVERDFDEDLGISVAYEGDGFRSRTTLGSIARALRVLGALGRSAKEQLREAPRFRDAQRRVLAALDAVDPASLPSEALAAHYDALIREVFFASESTYFTLIFHNSNLQSLFKDALKGVRGDFAIGALFAGLRDVSHLLPNLRLWEVSRRVRADAAALAWWRSATTAEILAALRAGGDAHGLAELRAHVAEFGYHSTRELDLTVPRFAEDPTFVVESCRKLLELDDGQAPAAAGARQAELHEAHRARLLGAVPFWRRRALARKLDEVRRFLWWREELRDVSTRTYHQIRRSTLAVARDLQRRGLLEREEDVFYLPVEEVLALLQGRLAAGRARAQVARNRLYYRSFAAFENPPDLGCRFATEPPKAPAGARVLRGIPCSPGRVSARVKVIRDIHDAGRLERGDLLVTRFTDPGWTPSFGLLAGVVTETGGLLSHAAVISREYGIPAVLAVRDATVALRDGQLVTLDGAAGSVVVHEEARAPAVAVHDERGVAAEREPQVA